MNAVRFDSVSKRFILRHERPRSLQELFLNALRLRTSSGKEEYWALRDVSFEVKQGEMVGIVGPNGAGKSTILKLISRIIEPTSGQVEANGRIGALLELGAGFHDDLTGRENVYLNGSILGFTKDELTRIYDDIVSFAEMESFIDVPVKQYSSGMFMRLGFSVAVHLRPEILLVDEVLAVGDRSFRLRCLDKIRELKQRGVTIVFVTHDLNQVREMCDRAIWLNGGLLQADGDVDQVVDEYVSHTLMHRGSSDASEPGSGEAWRQGTGAVRIVRVQLLDGRGEERQSYSTGEVFVARLHYRAESRITDPVFGISLHHADGFQILGPNTKSSRYAIDAIEGDGFLDFIIPSLPFLQGTYFLSTGVFDYPCIETFDYLHQAHSFRIDPGEHSTGGYGGVHVPSQWQLGRSSADDSADSGSTVP